MTALVSPELGAAHDIAGHGLHACPSPHLSLLPQTNSHALQKCTSPWHKSGDKRKWKEEICQQKTKKTEAIDLISLFSPNSHTVSVWFPSGLIYPDAQFQDITGGGKYRFFHMSKALWGLPWWKWWGPSRLSRGLGQVTHHSGHLINPLMGGECALPHMSEPLQHVPWDSSFPTVPRGAHLVMLDW